MRNKSSFIGTVIGLITLLMSSIVGHCQDQPQSTIQSSGDFYTLFQVGDNIELSTSETPNPNCPDDQADGDPDYFWDLGSLDAVDNGDGSATVFSDEAATYGVSVSCEQDFTDSNDNDYTQDTQTSSDYDTTVQIPATVQYSGSTDTSGSGTVGFVYNFILMDQGVPYNPMKNAAVTINETVDAYTATLRDGSGSFVGSTVVSGGSGVAFPISGTGQGSTGGAGDWVDWIRLLSGLSTMDSISDTTGSCTLTVSSHDHEYPSAGFDGQTYSFSVPRIQSDSWVWTDVATYHFFGAYYTHTYSSTSITPQSMNFLYLIGTLWILGAYVQPSIASNLVFVNMVGVVTSPVSKSNYDLADILNSLSRRGQKFFDIEMGRPVSFPDVSLGNNLDYSTRLGELLNSQEYGFEMRGSVMVIFDKRQRESGDAYPLNRKITNLKFTNVSLEDCFHQIENQVHIKIFAGGPLIGSASKVFPHFNLDLEDVSLREALFQISAQTGCKTWTAFIVNVAGQQTLNICFDQPVFKNTENCT